MPDRRAIVATCDAFVRAIGARDVDAIMACYAEYPTVEDPVGTPPKVGRDAVRTIYAESLTVPVASFSVRRIGPVTVVGDRAAFQLRIDAQLDDATFAVVSTDIMSFDEDSRILTKGAYLDMEAGDAMVSPSEDAVTRSPESVAREFLRARAEEDLDCVIGLLSDDVVFTDGSRGIHRGPDAVRAELVEIASRGGVQVRREVTKMMADEKTVIMERVDRLEIGGVPVHYEIAVALDVDEAGRITRWREYYDIQSIAQQLAAAGVPLPEA